MADKQVKLVFGLWEARKEMVVTVKGNTRGLSVIECAISAAYDELPYKTVEGREYAEIEMTGPAGELGVEDEEAQCEDWLADMLISAEIVALTHATDL